MTRLRTGTMARRALSCVLALLLAAGLVPVLPEAPRALAEEVDAIALDDGVAEDDAAGLDDDATEGTVELGDTGPTVANEGQRSVTIVPDEATKDALLDQLELVVQQDLAADEEEASQGEAAPQDETATDEEPALEVQSVSVANPRWTKDESADSEQVTTWDCVWFGSYPQTEVALGDAAYASLESANWDSNGDATVDGKKYRRISKENTTHSNNWKDDGCESATYRYFRYEPIKWRVLKVDGSKALVMADVALDDQVYNANNTDVTWANSSMRSWLNGFRASSNQPGISYVNKGFANVAFTNEEQSAIPMIDVVNSNNTQHGTAGGISTRDKIFLLSEAEVYDVTHGFADLSGEGKTSWISGTSDEARRCKMSDYARAMGAWKGEDGADDGNCYWWLRSPGNLGSCAVVVFGDGSVFRDGYDVNEINYAVRPALTINLTSSHVQAAGTVSSDGTKNEQAPVPTGGGTSGGGSVPAKESTSLTIGADASGSVFNGDALKFFPGNYEVKHGLVPVTFSKETEDDTVTYKLAIGIGREDILDSETAWSQYKSSVKDVEKGRLWYKAIKSSAQKNTLKPFDTDGFSVLPELSVTGFAEYKFKDGKPVSRAGSIVGEASWNGEAKWQFWTPIGPTYINLEGGAKAELEGQLEFDVASAKTSLGGKIKLTPNISLEGGYGICSVATVGVNGSAELPIQIVPATKAEFGAKASLHAYLVFVVDWSYDLVQFNVPLWDTTSEATTQAYEESAMPRQAKGTFNEVDRSYAERTSEWSGDVGDDGLSVQSGDSGAAFDVLQSSVMPNTLPQLAQVGNKKVMVFQQNDPERSTLNSSVLAYSVLDGGTWSEPRPVWDTRTLDAYADLALVGDDLYVTWQKEKARISGDVTSDSQAVLGSMAAASEVCVARFDASSNEFVDAQYVTQNDKLDMMPTMVENAGVPQVAYVRNTENSIDQSSGTNQLVVATKDGSEWSESELGDAEGHVGGIAAGSVGGQAEVAYATLGDTSTSPDASGSVRLARTGATLSGAGERPSCLQWEGPTLYWATDGLVRAYDATTGSTSTLNEAPQPGDGQTSASDAAVVGGEMRVLSNGGKTSVVWTSSDAEAAKSSVSSAVVGGDGALSGAVELSANGFGVAASDVVLNDDGTYGIAANTFDAKGTHRTHSLGYATLGTVGDLKSAGASAYAADDGTVRLTYGFHNNSESPVDGYDVVVRSAGQEMERHMVDAVVAPGASEFGELSFAAGTDASALTVEVVPADAGDARAPATTEAEVTTEADLDELAEDVVLKKLTSVSVATTSYAYDGAAKRPAVTVRAGDETVPESGYEVAYKGNVNAGTATATVTGKGAYEGTASATFKIAAASVAKAKVTGLKSRTYNGKKQVQAPKVTVGGRTLRKGTDYALSYKNNLKAGTATMYVKGKGNYAGTLKKTFKIKKAANPMRARAVKRTAKAAATKKRAVVVAAPLKLTKKAQGKVSYAKVAKGSSKLLSVNKKTGKVTVKKGTKKGTYKVRVKVTAKGNANYKALSKTVTCKVVVK